MGVKGVGSRRQALRKGALFKIVSSYVSPMGRSSRGGEWEREKKGSVEREEVRAGARRREHRRCDGLLLPFGAQQRRAAPGDLGDQVAHLGVRGLEVGRELMLA